MLCHDHFLIELPVRTSLEGLSIKPTIAKIFKNHVLQYQFYCSLLARNNGLSNKRKADFGVIVATMV
jgi:hypothetical protein